MVDANQFQLCRDKLIERVRNFDAVNLGRIEQAARMFLQAKNGWPGDGFVAPHAFKDGAGIADDVGEHVNVRVIPGDESAVVPYFFCRRHVVIMTAGRSAGTW